MLVFDGDKCINVESKTTGMANSGMNPTALQYLMGQSDISVTLGIYTHTKKEDAKAELKRVLSL